MHDHAGVNKLLEVFIFRGLVRRCTAHPDDILFARVADLYRESIVADLRKFQLILWLILNQKIAKRLLLNTRGSANPMPVM